MLLMTQPAKAPEPSMEEILASIRRIIADDDAAKPESGMGSKAVERPLPKTAPEVGIASGAEPEESESPDPSADSVPHVGGTTASDEMLEFTEANAPPSPEPKAP